MEIMFGFFIVIVGMFLITGIIIEIIERYYKYKQRRIYENEKN